MKLDVNFAENASTFTANFAESNESMTADFGELHVVSGGGTNGADGFSPTVDIEPIDGGHRISITDKDGTQTADVLDGRDGKDGADGYTPVKGVDYFDGQPGAKGDPGDPGADGISPTVAVQDITGGHRVTITDKYGAKTFDVMDGKDGEGGSGGVDSPAIIDVVALPETDINEDVFYRLLEGTFYYYGIPQADWTCYLVETLPTMGMPVTTDMEHVALYYAIDTQAVSGYIPDALAGTVGVPAGWYPVEALSQAFGLAWGGIFGDESEVPADGSNSLVLKYEVYYHKQKWVNLSDKIGWRSADASGAEVFNSLKNTANGNCSHAEGDYTIASGDNSHAEGQIATASGYASHAEGERTTASGYNSHAEGFRTTASGSSSHAEGEGTIASGDNSHAEGEYTVGSGANSHVQGKWNLKDTESKYAHIVGNGESSFARSNAHTLDWDGNAWYSGDVYVGSTSGVNRDEGSRKLVANGDNEIILTSPSGTRYRLTVADDGTLTTAAV